MTWLEKYLELDVFKEPVFLDFKECKVHASVPERLFFQQAEYIATE